MKRAYHAILMTLAGAIMLIANGCSSKDTADNLPDQLLIQYGDSTLMLGNVLSKMPAGLSEKDSIEMLNTITEAWLREMLLQQFAEENIVDIQRIDEMTEQYRRRLILEEYLKLMASSHTASPSNQEIKQYYDAHSQTLVLKKPLVRGAFLKVPADADRIDDIRRWMSAGSQQSIDQLEKNGLKEAQTYDYFADKWISFDEIEALIPYRFGNPDEFLDATKNYFEVTVNDVTYMLHIYDTIHSQNVMPLDFATPIIARILMADRRDEYVDRMVTDLAAKARKEGVLKTPGYDPSTHMVTVTRDANTHLKK